MGHYDNEKFTQDIARSGNFLVITFTKSKSELRSINANSPVRVKTREHWFFKVEASKRITYRPYNAGQAIAAYHQEVDGDADPYLDPDEGTQAAIPLVDQAGNEILRNDDDEWYVYHLSVAPLQGDVRVYPQIPDSQPGGVFQYLGANRPAGSQGDPVGYTSGDDHPSYYDPETGISTTLAWDSGINTPIKYQFYNEHKTQRRVPLLNISGAGYVLNPVTDTDVQENILEAANTGDESVTHVTWGPIRENFSYEVPDEWDTAGNYVEQVDPSIPSKFDEAVTLDEEESVSGVEQDLNNMSDDEIVELLRGAM